MEGSGLTGLVNLGNTCFMNSAIQCLSHTKAFRMREINEKESLYHEWYTLKELMWKQNCVISPKRFLYMLQQVAKRKKKVLFTGFAQNDLPEFLLFLLDEFHETLKKEESLEYNVVSCKGEKNNMDKYNIINGYLFTLIL